MNGARRAAHRALTALFEQGRSLSDLLDEAALQGLSDRDRSLCRALVYGVARHRRLLDALLDGLLDRPLKARDEGLRYWLVLGIYQLGWMRIPAHAAVNETVRQVRPQWARGLANAVLRRYQREGLATDLPDATPAIRHSHPDWLAEQLAQDWPAEAENVLAAGNREPPMWLRVDTRRVSPEACIEALQARDIAVAEQDGAALKLEAAVDIARLPGWEEGWLAVQDAASQRAAQLLAPSPRERILDACAAPGGKSLHLLALADIELTCVERDPARAARIEQNLARTGDQAPVRVADATDVQAWWDGRPYDAILLDATCSGTGVIRRHPDIKWLRRPSDIEALAATQQRLLVALWPLLRRGGRLLYTTCSILDAENAQTVRRFMQSTPDARIRPVTLPWGRPVEPGWQVLPGDADVDGFYYAMITRT